MDLRQYIDVKRTQVETALERYLPAEETSLAQHFKAMRYSLFAGGKRVRPILCIAAAESVKDFNNDFPEAVMLTACALECIHTYSLIHDDLPAMDDDDLRRGKPTNHMVYGEAGAILAGDSLLTLAFDLLSRDTLETISAHGRLTIISLISKAVGPEGKVYSIDISEQMLSRSHDLLEKEGLADRVINTVPQHAVLADPLYLHQQAMPARDQQGQEWECGRIRFQHGRQQVPLHVVHRHRRHSPGPGQAAARGGADQ